jgi:flagellar assembly protein FliH
MSSFRVERQCVAFQSRAMEPVQNVPFPTPDADLQAKEILEQAQAQAAQIKADAQKLLEETETERRTILEQAQQEVTSLLADGQRQAKAAFESEKARGLAEGQEAAEKENRAWRSQEQQALDEKSQALQTEYDRKLAEVQQELTGLAIEIAEKIIGICLDASDEAILHVIAEALARFRQNEEVVVHLSREDYQRFAGTDEIGQLEEAKGKNVTLSANASYKKGDCVVESSAEFVDCGVSGQLERLGEIFQKAEQEEENSDDGNSAEMPEMPT